MRGNQFALNVPGVSPEQGSGVLMRVAIGFALVCAATIGCWSSSARASFTPINSPFFTNEDGVQKILNATYGGTFTPSGLNFSNGTITAVRVEDIVSTPGIVTPPNGSPDDQLWQANFQLSSAEAIFGSFNQQFGYYLGASGGSYVNLFNVVGVPNTPGWGYDVTGGADLSSLSGKLLRWARAGQSRIVSSLIADNTDGKDHMVTYNIQGLNNGKVTWLLMFEDKFTGEAYADFDYNDLVVQITALPQVPIPEPVAIAPLILCGALGLRRKRIA